MPTSEYSPTVKMKASHRIKRAFEASAKFNKEMHDLQKRLYLRYLNESLRVKRSGYTNLQTGMVYYIVDILNAVIYDSVFTGQPPGKITGIGDEDFPGGQYINGVHKIQNNDQEVESANWDAVKYSIICGTGIKFLDWKYHKITYNDYIDETKFGMPTGNRTPVEVEQFVDKFDAMSIPPWHVFPTAGASSERTAHEVILLFPHTRKELKEMETDGYISDVDKIDKNAYGNVLDGSPYVSEYKLERAKKQEQYKEENDDRLWCLYFLGLFPLHDAESMSPEGDVDVQREINTFAIVPYNDAANTVLKLEENEKPGINITRERYDGTDDDFWGSTCLMIVEKLIVHFENIYGYRNDAAIRAAYGTLVAPEGMDQSGLVPRRPDAIVTIPGQYFDQHKKPYYLQEPSNVLPALIELGRETRQFIDEITSILEFLRGGADEGDETATKTTARMRFLSQRFKIRMMFYEKHGLRDYMEWETVLNVLYLSDTDFEQYAGVPAMLNPFKLIDPIIPLRSANFLFEGSVKAADDPVKAQIYKGLLEIAPDIPPGMNSKGEMVMINTMYIYEQFVKKQNPDEDIDKIFMPVNPAQLAAGQGAGGEQSSGLGAVTPGDLLGGNVPSPDAGIRGETI